MCGFLFSCSLESIPNHCLSLLHLVSRRGPDDLRTIQRSIYSPRDNGSEQAKPLFHFSLAASVLSLRGETIVTQPVLDDPSASFLVWNGEAWRLESRAVSGNDTTLVFRTMLTKCTDSVAIHQSEAERGKAVAEAVRDVLQAIDGPFSFLFFHGPTGLVFYGRDSFGRRSLLVSQDQTGNFRISSVSAGPDPAPWREVETGGIFMLGVSSAFVGAALSSDEQNRPPNFKSQFIPWLLNERTPPALNRDLSFPAQSICSPASSTVASLEKLLRDAVRVRLDPAPQNSSPHAILFSGGIDCTLLALLSDSVLPPHHDIDLLNVAFENPRIIAAANKRTTQDSRAASAPDFEYALCPDRSTGLSSYDELKKLRPARRWRFVSINVPYAESQTQTETVAQLMYPHNTEMDLSISLAFFFASKGSGFVAEAGQRQHYTTSARVLLSGLGADELFGGYSRHARAYDRRDFAGLLDELDLDFTRLSSRNLGRDDRVVSHWGREIRYPYLDEAFVKLALELPIREKCGFGVHTGADTLQHIEFEPGKLVLRHLAWKLGLKRAAREKKRAIQFGARTAKMEQSRKKGGDTI